MSKSFSTLFDNLRAAPFFRPLSGGSDFECGCHQTWPVLSCATDALWGGITPIVYCLRGPFRRSRPVDQARKRHININFLVRLPLGRPPVCPRDKPSFSLGQTRVVPGTNRWFSPYFTQCKPSLSQGQTQFVPGTNW